jgi:hypothetical protein
MENYCPRRLLLAPVRSCGGFAKNVNMNGKPLGLEENIEVQVVLLVLIILFILMEETL